MESSAGSGERSVATPPPSGGDSAISEEDEAAARVEVLRFKRARESAESLGTAGTTGPPVSTGRSIGGSVTLDADGYKMDGLRSAAVLVGAFYVFFLQIGFVTSIANYYGVLQSSFGMTSASCATLSGLLAGIMTICAVLSSIVHNVMGSRLCAGIGSTVATLGLLSFAFADHQYQLYISTVAIGMGFSLSLVSVIAVQVEYWERYRGFASSFVSVGGAVGSASMQFIQLTMIQRLGWRSAIVLTAGMSSVMLVTAAFARSRKPKEYAISPARMFRLHMFKNKAFLLIALNFMLWGGSAYSFFFLSRGLMMERGLSSDSFALMLTVLGIVNVVGRTSSSILNQMDWTNKCLFNAITCAMWSAAELAFTWPRDLGGFLAVAAFFGSGYGLMFPGTTTMLVEMFDAENAASANGFCLFCMGVGQVAVPPLAGKIAEFGSVEAAFYVLAAMGFTASAIGFLVTWTQWRLKREVQPLDLDALSDTSTLLSLRAMP